MATRAHIRFAERKEGVSFNEHPENVEFQIYHHYDGYPEYLGVKLAKFLEGYYITNGLAGKINGKIANGMGCLAAQLIANMKTEPGNVYLSNPKWNDDATGWEDWTYYIWTAEEKLIWMSIFDIDNECVFVGKPEALQAKYDN